MGAPQKYPLIEVTLGDVTGNRWFNVGKSLTIGRETGTNDILIPNRNVSRNHARIVEDTEGRHVLEDLGSHNGTLLNGRLARREILQDGDTINIADVTLRFQWGDAPAETQTVPEPTEGLEQLAKDTTDFIDLSELNPDAMDRLRQEKPSITDPWKDDQESPSRD